MEGCRFYLPIIIFSRAAAQSAGINRTNDPGTFTAFIGYEWTSPVKGNNLHRAVIYRDGQVQAKQTLPFTLADSADPYHHDQATIHLA